MYIVSSSKTLQRFKLVLSPAFLDDFHLTRRTFTLRSKSKRIFTDSIQTE